MPEVDSKNMVLQEQISLSNNWLRAFKTLSNWHWIIGGSSVVLSSILALKPFPEVINIRGTEINLYTTLAVAAALLTALLTFVKPEKRGEQYREAWSMLAIKIAEYRVQKAQIEDVLAARGEGEKIIHPK